MLMLDLLYRYRDEYDRYYNLLDDASVEDINSQYLKLCNIAKSLYDNYTIIRYYGHLRSYNILLTQLHGTRDHHLIDVEFKQYCTTNRNMNSNNLLKLYETKDWFVSIMDNIASDLCCKILQKIVDKEAEDKKKQCREIFMKYG